MNIKLLDTKLLDVEEYFKQQKEEIKAFNKALKIRKEGTRTWRTGVYVKLGIIDASDPQSVTNQTKIQNMIQDCKEMGWNCDLYKVFNDTDIREIISQAMKNYCTAIIVQLPVREGIRFNPTLVPSHVDCSGLNPLSRCSPITSFGIINYLKASDFPFSGKSATILGKDENIYPIIDMLLEQDMTVSVCHEKTPPYLKEILLKEADLIITAANKPGVLTRSECPKAIVINTSFNKNEDGTFSDDFIESSDIQNMSISATDGLDLLNRLAILQNCFILAGGAI